MTDPDLTPELLLKAYAAGIFPMAESRDDPDIFWVDPKARGVMPLTGFHLSRSLRRRLLSGRFEATVDENFMGVVEGCADRPETWINGTIRSLYGELHARGAAHSLEVWENDALAGGVYGVTLGAAFFGESMFSRRTDASKVALAYLVDHLRQAGFTLFDTQFQTDHLARLGGVEISRAEYRARLNDAMRHSADFGPSRQLGPAQDVVQRITQTS